MGSAPAWADDLDIDRAEWRADDNELRIDGKGREDRTVTVSNASNASQVLGSDRVDDDDEWELRVRGPSPVPCVVRARQSNGEEVTRVVRDAPANCDVVAGGGGGEPPAAGNLRITRASWDAGDRRLRVRGEGDDNRNVTVRNAFDLGQVLGRDEVESDGDWRVRRDRPSPVPCRVRAEQDDGQVDEMDVSNAPSDCAPKGDGNPPPPPPPANVAPTANANGPYSGNVGENISFSSAGSNDPDGNIVSFSWNFGDGSSSNNANPSHAYSAAGTYTVRLTVTDNDGASDTDTTSATVVDNNPPPPPPPDNVAPVCTITAPAGNVTITAGQSVSFAATATDSDGSIATDGWTFQGGNPASSNQTNVTVTYASAGSFVATFSATDNAGASCSATRTVTVQAVNPPPQQNCDPAANGNHEGCFNEYTGPEVCVQCHETEARDMHGSVHYQQNGPTDFVDNLSGLAGERGFDFAATGINTYCGTHENSPRFTCAGCHVGNGRFPASTAEFSNMNNAEQLQELANIDCLMCHQETYKRFPNPDDGFENLVLENVSLDASGLLVETPGATVTRTGIQGIPIVDPVTLDFQFIPADPTNPSLATLPERFQMTVTALQAAQTVHPTTRQSCLNCHGGAAGADGAKRGDLSSLTANPTVALDRHMSPQGANLTCSNCHDAGNHRVAGRGVDLRPNDVPQRLVCDNCHGATPHNNTTINRHTAKVACQTCHIPTYAKGIATEVARDWQDAHVTQTACNGRGGWLPREDKAGDLVPSYAWFDGNSEVYVLGENVVGNLPTVPLPNAISSAFRPSAGASAGNFDTGDPAYVLGVPSAILAGNGSINMTLGASNGAAKLYPMKEHWGKLALNTSTNSLIGHSTFEFFRTGDFDRAVAEGLAQTDGMGANDPYTVVPVHTFQSINHGVEVVGNALGANNQCNDCHRVNGLSGGPAVLDLKGQLGYSVANSVGWSGTSNGNVSCGPTCHGNETQSFTGLHTRSQHVARGCAACHDQISGR